MCNSQLAIRIYLAKSIFVQFILQLQAQFAAPPPDHPAYHERLLGFRCGFLLGFVGLLLPLDTAADAAEPPLESGAGAEPTSCAIVYVTGLPPEMAPSVEFPNVFTNWHCASCRADGESAQVKVAIKDGHASCTCHRTACA